MNKTSQRVSNCCGAEDRPCTIDGPSYSDIGICPDCREHCEFEEIDETVTSKNKTNWYKKSQVNEEVDDGTGISKDQFRRYVEIQKGGRYNMIMDGRIVMRLLRMDESTYLKLLENYERLMNKWPDVE